MITSTHISTYLEKPQIEAKSIPSEWLPGLVRLRIAVGSQDFAVQMSSAQAEIICDELGAVLDKLQEEDLQAGVEKISDLCEALK